MSIDYTPENLIDHVIEKMNLKNDAALSRATGLEPPVISKLRNKKLKIGASHLIKFHEFTELPIATLRELAGIEKLKK